DEERGHGDVYGEAGRQEYVPTLLPPPQRRVAGAGDAGKRAAPLDRAQRAGRSVPAEARPEVAGHHRRGGAAALVPARSRRAAAGPVSPAGGGDRPDRTDRHVGSEYRLPTAHGVETGRTASHPDIGQPDRPAG